MRRFFIAGNWKMNLTRQQSCDLAASLSRQNAQQSAVDIAICPASVYLDAVKDALAGSSTIGLGAQNVYHEGAGAFTGEISASMLTDIGCQYVILGHSERRHVLGESNQDVNRKVLAALAADLTPIVCVGETLGQRELNQTRDVVAEQFAGSLAGLAAEQVGRIVIAYEPVWAIGTGEVATTEQAETVHADLRRILENRYNSDVAQSIRIQYGGSVKPDNARQLLAQPNIDGALVGGASLQAESFQGIIDAARQLTS